MKHHEQLEAWARQTLDSLPLLSAPGSLIPSVLAHLRAQAMLPWYQRSWFFWPGPLRVLFVVMSSLLVGGLAVGLSFFPQASAGLAQLLDPASNLKFFSVLLNVFQRFMGANFLIYLAAGGLALYLVCIALGSACYQIVVSQKAR